MAPGLWDTQNKSVVTVMTKMTYISSQNFRHITNEKQYSAKKNDISIHEPLF